MPSINCHGRLMDFRRPRIMGILNVTPDSFFAGSRVQAEKDLLKRAEQMLSQGADILDVGGYSSRPGATEVDEAEERRRLIPAIRSLRQHFPDVPVSADTFRSRIAREAVEAGACMVNDISAGNLDGRMFRTIARLQVPYVLMHMKGTPQTMQLNPEYDDVVMEINRFLARKIKELHRLHVNDIIVDPGFGFGKTLDDNYRILKHLDTFLWHDKILMVGLSRKSMLYKLLGGTPDEMLSATTAVHMIALQKGARLLRVHDVGPAREAVDIFMQMQRV